MIPESLLLSGFGWTFIGFLILRVPLLNMSFKNGQKDIILIRVWVMQNNNLRGFVFSIRILFKTGDTTL